MYSIRVACYPREDAPTTLSSTCSNIGSQGHHERKGVFGTASAAESECQTRPSAGSRGGRSRRKIGEWGGGDKLEASKQVADVPSESSMHFAGASSISSESKHASQLFALLRTSCTPNRDIDATGTRLEFWPEPARRHFLHQYNRTVMQQIAAKICVSCGRAISRCCRVDDWKC
jgi:hypothetical protein